MRAEEQTDISTGEDLLVLKNVHKNYGSVQALQGIDFIAKKGECLVILGPVGWFRPLDKKDVIRVLEMAR